MSVTGINENTTGDPGRPILVYTMGKVGTGSIIQAIADRRTTVYKAHSLDRRVLEHRIERAKERDKEPETDLLALDFVLNILPQAERIQTITVVRESIGRNISGFFQSLWRHGLNPPYASVRAEDLVDLFFRKYNHDRPDQWFRQEFRKFIGVRPFDFGFDPAAGHHRFQSGRFDVLMMQAELGTAQTSVRVSDFLGLDVVIERTHNQSEQKGYGELYRRFKQIIEFPHSYLEHICRSRVMRRFYTEEQREHMVRFYRREIPALHPFPRPL